MVLVAGDAGRFDPQPGLLGAVAASAIIDAGDQYNLACLGPSRGMALLALQARVLFMIEPGQRQKTIVQQDGRDNPAWRLRIC